MQVFAKKWFSLVLTGCLCIPFFSHAQAPEKLSASDIQLALKKLNVLGSVLYLAAHPDDENQVVIGYLSQTKMLNTGYLSLTRGDGGQNLIGSEIRELLGVIRTQELIQARKVDGSRQFFSRAVDFGFSKTTEETLNLWNEDSVMADVVWVIRQFRPDIIINRFPPDQRAGHGHHSTSAVLAAKAFKLAADPKSFPEQLQYVKPWQATRLLLNDTEWFTEDIAEQSKTNDSILAVNTGIYSPWLGKSVTEIAAESRSKHESQGFGATGSRGTVIEYFRQVEGALATDSLLQGINTSWSRVKDGKKVGDLLQKAYRNFNPSQPEAIVPTLLEASEALSGLSDDYWKREKGGELKRVIAACMGLYLETRAGTNELVRRRGGEKSKTPGIAEYAATPGDTVTLQIEAINRSGIPAALTKISFTHLEKDTVLQLDLKNNIGKNLVVRAAIPEDMPYSAPYWLKEPHDGFTFQVADQQLIGLDETPAAIEAHYTLSIAGKSVEFTSPVVYKYNDPRSGESYQPFVVTPPIFTNIPEKVLVFASGDAKSLPVSVKAGKAGMEGEVSLELPEGWRLRVSRSIL